MRHILIFFLTVLDPRLGKRGLAFIRKFYGREQGNKESFDTGPRGRYSSGVESLGSKQS